MSPVNVQQDSLSQSELAHYARELSDKTERHKQEYAQTDSSALIFTLGQELYGLPAAALREVLEAPKIHSIPRRRGGAVLGLANFRGELILCVDLKRLLAIETAEPPGSSALMLVLGWHNFLTGCLVDDVRGVFRFRRENLRPRVGGTASSGLVVGLLDLKNAVASMLGADAIVGAAGG